MAEQTAAKLVENLAAWKAASMAVCWVVNWVDSKVALKDAQSG